MTTAVPKTEQIIATVTPRLLVALDRYAEAREISRAEAIRRFVEDGLFEDAARIGVDGRPKPRNGAVLTPADYREFTD